MAAMVLFCQMAGMSDAVLSKEENLLFEVDLFTHICEELKELYKQSYQHYFRALRFSAEMEQTFMETHFIREVIQDILGTEEYSISGLAYYTCIPEDVFYDIAAGNNTDPSASLLRKIIALHRTVRPELYRGMMQKILQHASQGRAA